MKPQAGFARLPVLGALCTLLGFSASAQTLRLFSQIDPTQALAAGGSGDSRGALVSENGRHVLFASAANNLLVNSNNMAFPARFPAVVNAFLRDRIDGTTTLVSVNLAGTGGGDGNSVPLMVSTSGRYVLFESEADDLVTGDTNGVSDVFVRDLVSGTTLLVSSDPTGLAGNGESHGSIMTPDGRYVAFVSSASNLVTGDTNGIADVFIRDMLLGTTALASVGAVSTNNSLPQGGSEAPLITPDGRYVAFFSTATNLVPGVPPGGDIYVRDMVAQTTTWASAGARSTLQGVLNYSDAVSYNHAISDDGQFVAYEISSAAHPGPAYPGLILLYNGATAVTTLAHTNAEAGASMYQDVKSLDMTPDGRFVGFIARTNDATTTCVERWDATTGVAELVSGDVSSNQVPVGSTCAAPVMDRTGRAIAFVSSANILNSSNYPGGYHIYLRDMAGTTMLVDGDTNGVGSVVNPASTPSLSADGRFVAFEADDGDLVPNDRNRDCDVFLRDTQAGTVEMASARHPLLPSLTPNGPSLLAVTSISSDGRYVAFGSEADNLVANDTNGCRDIFVRDLVAGTNWLASVATNGALGDGLSSDPAISADGRFVAFSSSADNLVAGDTNGVQDVFIRDLQEGTTSLVSVKANGTGPGNGASFSPVLSQDGRFVLFLSRATDVASGTIPSGYENLFLRDRQRGITYALSATGGYSPVMTPDGRRVAWVEANISGYRVYVRDSAAAARIYTNSSTYISWGIGLSRDGNHLAYWSGYLPYTLSVINLSNRTSLSIASATTFVANRVLRFSGDSGVLVYNNTNQIFYYEVATGSNVLVSHAFGLPAPGGGMSDTPDISADGRFIAYRSAATNLVAGDTNTVPDIFLYDRQTGSNALLTADQFGGFNANGRSLGPVFSGDGRMLFFQSWASDLVTEDFNHYGDVFAYAFFYAILVPGSGPGEGMWLAWPFDATRNYRVEYSDNLGAGVWRTLSGTITNSAGRAWVQDTAPDANKRFYRVVAF